MRAILIAAVAVLALAGCGEDAGATEEDVTASGAPAPLPGPNPILPARAGDFQTGEAVIRALYAEPTIPVEPATIRRFFPEEFVSVLMPTADGVSIDFDYRISGQDGDAGGLQVEEMAGGPTGSLLVSRFTNLGVTKQITWTVCRQPDGALRIVEAQFAGAGDDHSWSLREVLDLPKRGDAC